MSSSLLSGSAKIKSRIHTLRGEYYRHTQNKKGLPRDLSQNSSTNHRSRTLPPDLLQWDDAPKPEKPLDHREALFIAKRVTEDPPDFSATPGQRADALSVVIPEISPSRQRLPSLTTMCIKLLVSKGGLDEFIVQHIPPHLGREILRWTAVHLPLTTSELKVLCGPPCIADGELIVVGPGADPTAIGLPALQDDAPADEWDADDGEDLSTNPMPLHTFVVLTAPVSLSILQNLPFSLTHIGLINIPNPVPLHRLPAICPSLEVLDLSYNSWLKDQKGAHDRLGALQWSRWHHLRVIGLRRCWIGDLSAVVNSQRWDDVTIIS
ncbi:unnamed protein product [Mycena citricolor]|uniref:Uncharacterized protein n=1 Tax=Mycena citricolor TaxID=2018698 RepID=A0AAD2GVX7_9AGAR|nr:unnamed protein product [Mycena citricolor]